MLIGLFAGVSLIVGFFSWKFHAELQALRLKYARITALEEEEVASGRRIEKARQSIEDLEVQERTRREALGHEYSVALSRYQELKKELGLLEENLEDISFGVYKPHFDFNTSDEYRDALEKLREEQRFFVRSGNAASCPLDWSVGDSKKEGSRMVKLLMKLLLRAFNGECEAAVADVGWNNITKMEERVCKSFEVINKAGDVLKVAINRSYLQMKLSEIHLKYEYEQKKQHEKEEQRRIREQIREEERAEKEIEKAKEDSERDEERYQKALEKAREEVAKATGAQLTKLTEQISTFEAKLDEARKRKDRAIARAQITKSGFVYVISNIGSFGEQVFKIGMTRRMEPMERVSELGDASVPFPFDLHAMLYSDNAPELEGSLHQHFEDRRLNLVNRRREFYRDVDIDELERFVKARGLSAQFIHHPEAREYRESMTIRAQRKPAPLQPGAEQFASQLFSK